MTRRRKTVAIPLGRAVSLTPEQSAAFDRLKQIEARLTRLERLRRAAKKLRHQLADAFQGAGIARTNDGRLIGRFQQSRQLPALPAKEIRWNEFQELPSWDG